MIKKQSGKGWSLDSGFGWSIWSGEGWSVCSGQGVVILLRFQVVILSVFSRSEKDGFLIKSDIYKTNLWGSFLLVPVSGQDLRKRRPLLTPEY